MTKVYLVRHGETDWNRQGRIQGRENIPLNANGLRQALYCGLYLKKFMPFAAVISSPLDRARKTAEVIAETLEMKREIIIMNDLIERDFGEISGLLPEERELRLASGETLGIETQEDLRGRAMKALNTISAKFRGDGIIVVAHGAIINAMLAVISEGKIGTHKTLLTNGGVSVIENSGERWSVELHDHIPPLPFSDIG